VHNRLYQEAGCMGTHCSWPLQLQVLSTWQWWLLLLDTEQGHGLWHGCSVAKRTVQYS
jgi:hypothetical protein